MHLSNFIDLYSKKKMNFSIYDSFLNKKGGGEAGQDAKKFKSHL
jgi:hypothetical protein